MNDQNKPAPRPRPRFLRFSVRGLIVLVLAIGAGLGWLVRSARVQREAVVALENAGGRVYYDWQWTDHWIKGGKPRAPRCLVDVFGVDYFGHVVAVNFYYLDGSAAEAEMAHIERLSALVDLRITGRDVSDAQLAHLERLTSLRLLGLERTAITGAGLSHLKGLNNLTVLWLAGAPVTDVDLAHLKGLTNLTELYIENTPISDAGLAHLKGLNKLSHLDVRFSHVTDAGIKELKRTLPRLNVVR